MITPKKCAASAHFLGIYREESKHPTRRNRRLVLVIARGVGIALPSADEVMLALWVLLGVV
jgi:hypothetical protein